MDNPDNTMEEYVQYETEKALRNNQVFSVNSLKLNKDNDKDKIAFGWLLEEIHVTWTQFGKKQNKIATLHEEAQKLYTNCGDGVRISSYAVNGIRILAIASERNRLKEALEDSAEQL
ncbi:hypothetical protein Tco_0740007 [Tanacetum coccineum]